VVDKKKTIQTMEGKGGGEAQGVTDPLPPPPHTKKTLLRWVNGQSKLCPTGKNFLQKLVTKIANRSHFCLNKFRQQNICAMFSLNR
jgi:hypothetical protein